MDSFNPGGDDAAAISSSALLYKALRLAACICGIYVMFLFYGLIQEKIYFSDYAGESFSHAMLLMLLQSLGNVIFSALMLHWSTSDTASERKLSIIPHSLFAQLASVYVCGVLLSNTSLSYLTYPQQNLAKSAKIHSVFLARIFFVGAKYHSREWMQVSLISSGIVLFMVAPLLFAPSESTSESSTGIMSNNKTDVSWFSATNSFNPYRLLLGNALCIGSLVFDSMTGPLQERLFKNHNPSTSQMMLYLNAWASIIVLLALCITGKLIPGFEFAMKFPHFLGLAFLFGLCASLGQFIILITLELFNSYVLATITTTRKFFSILLSVLVYDHALLTSQWIGVGLVFLGLSLELQNAYTKHKMQEARLKALSEDHLYENQKLLANT